jgi:GNAT superfamily N-acetyltransferase
VGAVEARERFTDIWGRVAGNGSIWAGSPFPWWNAVTLTGSDVPPEELSEQLAGAAAFLREQSEGGYLWVFDDLLSPQVRPELEDRAAAAGLEIAFRGQAMDGEPALDEPVHPDLVFRRVADEDDLAVLGEINAFAYDLPAPVGQAAFAGAKLWRDEAYAYLGYRDGRPVTAAAAVPSADALVVTLVATLPEQSRRGYGQAVTAKAIVEAARRTGRHRVVLHSTVEGRPVFERLGLRPTTLIHYLQPAGAVDDLGD